MLKKVRKYTIFMATSISIALLSIPVISKDSDDSLKAKRVKTSVNTIKRVGPEYKKAKKEKVTSQKEAHNKNGPLLESLTVGMHESN